MNLLFDTGEKVKFKLNDTAPALVSRNQLKHLQHVDIPFREWDLPYQLWQTNILEIVKILVEYGKAVGVDVVPARCIDQQYINQLHEIYEREYDGSASWLLFHENLHLLEKRNRTNHLRIDYRELGGLVEKPFLYDWLALSQMKIPKGTIYTQWSELGKTPFDYWASSEANNLTRLTELSKPWLKYKSVFKIALTDLDLSVVYADQKQNFEIWWDTWSSSWCEFWNIPKWTIEQMHSGIVLGEVENADLILELLIKGSKPQRLTLS